MSIDELSDYIKGIRYWKGKQKIQKISGTSPMKTAKYLVLEDGELGEEDTIHILPYRHCWRERK